MIIIVPIISVFVISFSLILLLIYKGEKHELKKKKEVYLLLLRQLSYLH